MKLIRSLAVLCLLQSPGLAAATTVTFDGDFLSDDGRSVEVESQGFLYRSSLAYWFGDDIVLHDDFGITRTAISRADGRTFTPKAIDVSAVNLIMRTGPTPPPPVDAGDAFDAWTVAGEAAVPVYSFLGVSERRGGVQVSFGPQDLRDGAGQLLFSDLFADISVLWVEVAFPDTLARNEDGDIVHVLDPQRLSAPGTDWCAEYCGELRVDNLVVDGPVAVPLPASAWLLGSPLLLLASGAAAARLSAGGLAGAGGAP